MEKIGKILAIRMQEKGFTALGYGDGALVDISDGLFKLKNMHPLNITAAALDAMHRCPEYFEEAKRKSINAAGNEQLVRCFFLKSAKVWDRVEARKHIIEVLRSGKYKQGTGALCWDGNYCCVGVMAEEFLPSADLRIKLPGSLKEICYAGVATMAPVYVVELLGLYNKVGRNKSAKKSLLTLNDHDRYTFKEIADELETGDYWK